MKKKSKQGDLVSKDNVDERKQRNEFVNETKEVSVEVEAVEQQKTQQPAKRGQKVSNSFAIIVATMKMLNNPI